MAKKPTKSELERFAIKVREKLSVPKQSDVFRAAVEAAYLAAMTDGTLDEAERKAIVAAVETLSQGAVIEWEADALVDACAKETGDLEARAKKVGEKLKALGAPDAGVLFATFVAQATQGIDKKEEAVLKSIAKAAGLPPSRLKEYMKDVGSDLG